MTPFSTLYSLTSRWILIISLTLSKFSKCYLPSPPTTYGIGKFSIWIDFKFLSCFSISFSYGFFETKHEFINFWLLQRILIMNIKWFFFIFLKYIIIIIIIIIILFYVTIHISSYVPLKYSVILTVSYADIFSTLQYTSSIMS